MKKVLKQVVILLAMAITVAGCNSSAETNNEDDGQSTSLEGTKWKLQGIADVKTGALKVLEPKDCEESYTLTFDTDSTASGKSYINVLLIKLKPEFHINIATEVFDSQFGDVALFYEAIQSIISYELNKNEIKFYYNDNNNYLLFKQIEP